MVAALAAAMCSREVRNVQVTPDKPATIAELWQEPGEPRDLFHGPGGKELLPRSTAFTFVAEDTTGYSPGFDVRDDERHRVERQDRAGGADRSRDLTHPVGDRLSPAADLLPRRLVA